MMQKNNKIFSILSLFLLAFIFKSQCVWAQVQSQLKAKVDANELVIGDQMHVFVEAQKAKGETFNWVLDPAMQGLEIVEKSKIDTQSSGDKTVYKQTITVTGFDSGAYVIPPFTLNVQQTNGQFKTIATDSFSVNVQTVPVDTAAAYMPLKNIEEVKKEWWEYWPWAVGIIVLLGVGLGLWYYFKNRNKVKEPVITPEVAHVKALKRIQSLEQSDLYENGDIKQYYSELTDILRTYVDERFLVSTGEMTTEDLIKFTKKHEYLNRVRPEFKIVFTTADLAKFAKFTPHIEEKEAALKASFKIIEDTRVRQEEGQHNAK